MNKRSLLKSLLLLCALVAGSGSVWAADVIDELTVKGWASYSGSCETNGTDHEGTSATTSVKYIMQAYSGSSGQVRGNQSNDYANFSCRNSTTYSGYYIKEVKLVVTAGTLDGSASGRSVVYFGKSAFGNPKDSDPTGTAVVSTENASGKTTLTWSNSDKSASYFILYNIKTSGTTANGVVTVTWASTSTDPSIDADDVIIECDETSGEIAYTINNPNGSTLTAAEKSPGYDWIDNVTVDSENSKVTFTTTANTGIARDGYITLTYGAISKDVKVTQRLYVAKYKVNISAMTNGSVAADVSTAAAGATVTLTVTPSAGYKLSTITVTDADEGNVTLSGIGNTRTFTMPAKAVTVAATFERDYSITFDFAFASMGTKDNANKDWGGSYAAHTQDFAGATIAFASASKQGGTITDVPVTKNNTVILTLTDANATIKSATFGLKHWNNKVVTITMYYSTDGGESWTTTGQSHSFAASPTYEDATLTASTLPAGTNALKILAGTEQQYGVAYATLEIDSKISIASACTDGAGNYYGTYSNDLAFIVPEGVTISAVGVSDGKLVVTQYAEGDVVKANTGVLVSAATAGDKTITLSAETGIEKAGNLLKPSGDAGITAANMTEANTKFYRLTMHDGSKIGFWWGAADGAAFNLAANKAYLAVPTATAAPSFFWFGGETTAIRGIENGELRIENGVVFNLAGQRVAQPTKGLYIVNGRKVVLK